MVRLVTGAKEVHREYELLLLLSAHVVYEPLCSPSDPFPLYRS